MPPAESPTAFKDEGLNSRWAEAAAEEAPSSDEPLQEESTDDSTMSLNVAYEALETVRTLNLQAEFGESVKLDDCLLCLRDPPPPIRGFRGQRVKAFLNKKPTSCLTCGTHVCGTHRSAEFWKQSIVVCNDCAPLFSVPFMLEQVTLLDQSIRKKNMNHILEVYDRALILLKYSGQFIPDVAEALEANTSRHNKIGLGTSATGVLSGVVGVAAAATIFTPVGPPLLVASILFGGTSTAVTAGSEAVNYRSSPSQMANRILTLNGILTAIQKLPQFLLDEPTDIEDDDNLGITPSSSTDESQRNLHWRRTAVNAIKPLTAGVLSALSIVSEAREMKSTLDKIKAGNPCDKADNLRDIYHSMGELVETNELVTLLQDNVQARLQQMAQDASERELLADNAKTEPLDTPPETVLPKDEEKLVAEDEEGEPEEATTEEDPETSVE